MAPRIEAERLWVAWRALSGNRVDDGWLTIPIELDASCLLMAGRHFPGDEEAVLVGFRSIKMPPDSHLPQGHGFKVERLTSDALGDAHDWLALSRKVGGSLDLFAMMAGDAVRLLESSSFIDEERLFKLFLSRIRAWQDFMERGRDGVLDQESEIGLLGEMLVLKGLLDAGVPADMALDSWQGPLDSLQDFILGSGAIEVKTTVSANGFPATISSLEQLDETLRQPLFVAAVRLALDSSGKTLPEFAAEFKGLLREQPGALGTLENRLLQAGYLEALEDKYIRRFTHSSTSLLLVEGEFPRLTRHHVSASIARARYELNLDLASIENVGLIRALELLGVI